MSSERERFSDTFSEQEEENPIVVNGEKDTTDTKKSAQVRFVIPQNVKYLIQQTALKEERTVAVVIKRALKMFLSTETCEDRPYIPEVDTKGSKITFTADCDLIEKLTARAKNEGRTVSMLIVKAVFKYLSEVDRDE